MTIKDLLTPMDRKNEFSYTLYAHNVGLIFKTDYYERIINAYGDCILDSWEVDCENCEIEIWTKEN